MLNNIFMSLIIGCIVGGLTGGIIAEIQHGHKLDHAACNTFATYQVNHIPARCLNYWETKRAN